MEKTMNAHNHDRFITIKYFVHEMLGMKAKNWYYDHVNDPGVPQRITVGGVPKLSLRECIAYQEMLKGAAPTATPFKRKLGRPRKIRPQPAPPSS
jgi:hypothetical protein